MSHRAARVILAYAQVKVLDPATGQPTMRGFYRDALLPDAADPADVERLVRRGYAEWVEADPPAAPAEPSSTVKPVEETKPPAGTKAAPAKVGGA